MKSSDVLHSLGQLSQCVVHYYSIVDLRLNGVVYFGWPNQPSSGTMRETLHWYVLYRYIFAQQLKHVEFYF